jgi:uncharacterized protein
MGFKEWIIPQDRVFYDLLEKQAALAEEAVGAFTHLLAHFKDLPQEREKVKAVENRADTVGHEIFDRLNRTFITPIDREDIARLAHNLDDIVDGVYGAANRLALCGIPEATPEMAEFVKILEVQVKELRAAINALRKPSSMAKAIGPRLVEIHRQENLADRLLDNSTAELFRSKDPVRILKYKEVYEFLELATDEVENCADVLRDIVRKHG